MLEISDMDVFYGRRQALFGLSLRVGEGELVTLLGGNGAGKTTTLNTISGLLRPGRGAVSFCGERIDLRSPSDIVTLGVSQCPEGRRVWPDMTVEENLLMGGYVHRRKRRIADKLEEIYELYPILKERQNQLAGTLSGGEQQMLAIGRALLSSPKLLLLDEPSLGLAPIVVERTAQIIKSIRAGGTTVLLVEQNARLALDLADRAYVVETGRIVLEGDARTLPDDDYVQRAYLGAL